MFRTHNGNSSCIVDNGHGVVFLWPTEFYATGHSMQVSFIIEYSDAPPDVQFSFSLLCRIHLKVTLPQIQLQLSLQQQQESFSTHHLPLLPCIRNIATCNKSEILFSSANGLIFRHTSVSSTYQPHIGTVGRYVDLLYAIC